MGIEAGVSAEVHAVPLSLLIVLASCAGPQVKPPEADWTPAVYELVRREPEAPPERPSVPQLRLALAPRDAWEVGKQVCEFEPGTVTLRWRQLPVTLHAEIVVGRARDDLRAYVDEGIVDCNNRGCWTETKLDDAGCAFICDAQRVCLRRV